MASARLCKCDHPVSFHSVRRFNEERVFMACNVIGCVCKKFVYNRTIALSNSEWNRYKALHNIEISGVKHIKGFSGPFKIGELGSDGRPV